MKNMSKHETIIATTWQQPNKARTKGQLVSPHACDPVKGEAKILKRYAKRNDLETNRD